MVTKKQPVYPNIFSINSLLVSEAIFQESENKSISTKITAGIKRHFPISDKMSNIQLGSKRNII